MQVDHAFPITILTSASCVLWSVAAALLLVDLACALMRNRDDEWRAVALFAAILIVSFNLRRIFQLGDGMLLPLYLLSVSLAAFVIFLLWRGRKL